MELLAREIRQEKEMKSIQTEERGKNSQCLWAL
jgi:hypothetical protein